MAYHGLNLSDAKIANIKSSCYLKLEAMILTLDRFRSEMDGNRIPKFEIAFLDKKKKELERQKRIKERQERKEKVKQLQDLNPKAVEEYTSMTGYTPRKTSTRKFPSPTGKQR